MVREQAGPGDGAADETDPTPENAGGDMSRSAHVLKQVKNRVRRLEEARATRRDLQGGFKDPEDILTPITRVVDRRTTGDAVTVTLKGGATSQFIDDFEDADMDEYNDPNNRADTQTYPVSQGQYSVQVSSASDGTLDPVISTNGLPKYPEAGDTYRYETLISSTGESESYHYFASDSTGQNAYRLRLSPGNNTLTVDSIDSGSANTILTVSLSSVPLGEWLQVEIDWGSSGGFTVVVEAQDGTELGTGSTSNSRYLSGGIGWGATAIGVQAARTAHFDFCRAVVSSSYIDDFEDRNITEYSGDTGKASVRGTSAIPTNHGSYALELGATVIDNFEDGDIAEYAGDTASGTVQTNTVKNGSNALELDGT